MLSVDTGCSGTGCGVSATALVGSSGFGGKDGTGVGATWCSLPQLTAEGWTAE